MKKHCYTAILENQQILFLSRQQVTKWDVLGIEGENINRCDSPAELGELLHQIDRKLNYSNQLADVEIHFLYGENQLPLLTDVPQQLKKLGCDKWQILQWQPIFRRACTSQKPTQSNVLNDEKWLTQTAMPMFEHSLNYEDKAWEAERQQAKHQHAEDMESLKADRKALEAEITALRGQIQAMQRPNMEQITTFLPVIYRNFWSHITPSDVALLAGTYEVPTVPSPFPEPDDFTIATKKKQFLAMPEDERRRLLDFCASLSINKHIRPTMRDLFEE